VLGTGTDEWLERLGSSASTPGGGAAAALAAAMGAALVEMVVNLTLGRPAYAEHEEHVRPIGEHARALRRLALDLVVADEVAFEAVTAAYRLPKGTDEERAARAEAIQVATAAAALESAAINVEVNLAALGDTATRERLRGEQGGHLEAIGRGRQLVMSVRARLGD
jgi:methenyltetrahydrofolate cyclohydrolase